MGLTLDELLHHIKRKWFLNAIYVDVIDEFADYVSIDDLDSYGHYKVNSWELDLETMKLTLEIEGE